MGNTNSKPFTESISISTNIIKNSSKERQKQTFLIVFSVLCIGKIFKRD